MHACDNVQTYNYAALVVWNNDDADQAEVALLREILRNIFPNKSFMAEPNFYLESVSTKADLIEKLSQAIETARGQISKFSAWIRRAQPDGGSGAFNSLSATTISATAVP